MQETWAIVVVEENAATARLIQEALNTVPGYGAVTIDTGTAALEVIAAVRADLVLLDLDPPRFNAFYLHDRLRDCIATAGVRVLYLADEQHTAVLSHRGVHKWIRMPFTTDDLLAQVRAALDKGPLRYAPRVST